MNHCDRRITRLYDEFLKNVSGTIESYFQITHSKYKLDRISTREFLFTIYQDSCPFVYVALPSELNIYINAFLYEYAIVTYSLVFPSDYPFHPPIWSIAKSSTNTLKNFNRIVHYQNYRYSISWSPAITIEKDILNMIDAHENSTT
jgi:hypothetical protein